MAKKSGGISFSTIIMGIVFYNLFFGGGDDTDKNEIKVEEDKPSISVKIEKTYQDIKPELDKMITEAKDELDKIRDELVEKQKEKEKEKPPEDVMVATDDDPYSDDRYGNNEEKW